MKGYSYGFIFPFCLKKSWRWFADPVDVPHTAMVNFFSYDQVEKPDFERRRGLTTVIDLWETLEVIWSRMRKDFICKQIERGERNGIRAEKSTDFKGFKKVYDIFLHGKHLPKDNYLAVAQNGILFTACYDKEMVAGGVFISDGTYMRAWILSSLRQLRSGRAKEVIGQANRMIIWEAIKYAKATGHELFDLGGIDPVSNDENVRRVAEFKEAFGGERRPCFYYHKIYSPLLRWWNKVRRYIKR